MVWPFLWGGSGNLPKRDDAGELPKEKSELARIMCRKYRATYAEEAPSVAELRVEGCHEKDVPEDGHGDGDHDEDASLLDLPGNVRDDDRPDGCNDEGWYCTQLDLDGCVSSEGPDDGWHESRKTGDRDLNDKVA